MEALLPRVPSPGAPLPELIPARGTRRGRAGLLLGCAQRFLYPDVNADTARLLAAAGYDVVVPQGAGMLRRAAPARRTPRRVPRDGAPADGRPSPTWTSWW